MAGGVTHTHRHTSHAAGVGARTETAHPATKCDVGLTSGPVAVDEIDEPVLVHVHPRRRAAFLDDAPQGIGERVPLLREDPAAAGVEGPVVHADQAPGDEVEQPDDGCQVAKHVLLGGTNSAGDVQRRFESLACGAGRRSRLQGWLRSSGICVVTLSLVLSLAAPEDACCPAKPHASTILICTSCHIYSTRSPTV